MKIKLIMLSLALAVMSAFAFSPHRAAFAVSGDVAPIINRAGGLGDCGDPTLSRDTSTGLCLPTSTVTSPQTVNSLLVRTVNFLLAITAIVAIIFIVIGGFQYITSAGNEEQATKGKRTVVNAIIGLVLIILAYVIVSVINNAASCVGGQGLLNRVLCKF